MLSWTEIGMAFTSMTILTRLVYQVLMEYQPHSMWQI